MQTDNLNLPLDSPPPPPVYKFTEKMPLHIAENIARFHLRLLQNGCSKLLAGGSIRRRKNLVKDIEIVAIERHPGNCFNALHVYRCANQIAPVSFWICKGERHLRYRDRFCLHNPRREFAVTVDLFLSQREYWGWTLFLRTGSTEWNIAAVCEIKRRGYEIKDNKILSPNPRRDDKDAIGPQPAGHYIQFPDEQSVFDFLGIPYVEPQFRTDGDAFRRAQFKPRSVPCTTP